MQFGQSERKQTSTTKKPRMNLPDDVIMEIAKSLLPDIVAFYETEEGKEVTRQLEAEEGAAKLNEQKTA